MQQPQKTIDPAAIAETALATLGDAALPGRTHDQLGPLKHLLVGIAQGHLTVVETRALAQQNEELQAMRDAPAESAVAGQNPPVPAPAPTPAPRPAATPAPKADTTPKKAVKK